MKRMLIPIHEGPLKDLETIVGWGLEAMFRYVNEGDHEADGYTEEQVEDLRRVADDRATFVCRALEAAYEAPLTDAEEAERLEVAQRRWKETKARLEEIQQAWDAVALAPTQYQEEQAMDHFKTIMDKED